MRETSVTLRSIDLKITEIDRKSYAVCIFTNTLIWIVMHWKICALQPLRR